MSLFSIHMLALAGIEVIIGLTVIGTLLAIVAFFVGSSKEKKVVGVQPEIPSDYDAVVKVQESGVMPTSNVLNKEAMGVPEKIEKVGGEPVMALLQKPGSEGKPELPEMPNIAGGLDLPVSSAEPEQAEGEELERQIVEKQLQRIADKRAEQKKAELTELPEMPAPPKKVAEKSPLPPIPKPFLHELPQSRGSKQDLPPPSKIGGDLPPKSGSANI